MKIPSPVQILKDELYASKGLEVFIKRDDLIDSRVSGNKWRKLKYNIEKYKTGGYQSLLTFGGAYSNHIAATAALCNDLNVPSIGVIRGDELNEESNETLCEAAKNGMKLVFTAREEYDLREEKYYHEELRRRHGNCLIVPEGGKNYYGLLGCIELLNELDNEPDYIVLAAGTGTTAAGILLGTNAAQICTVPVLKGGEFIEKEISKLLSYSGLTKEDCREQLKLLNLITDYHFGGYAKYTNELIDFINDFKLKHGIQLDQVYTGKMMFALDDLVKKDYFKPESSILAIHTGGLQGITSIEHLLLV